MKLIKFSAAWCGPCKTLKPVFEKVVTDNNYNATEVDIDDDTDDLVSKYGIRNVPTIIITDDNGDMLGRLVGMQSAENIVTKVNELM